MVIPQGNGQQELQGIADQKQEKELALVDRLLKIIAESNQIRTLVGHRWPDDDCWLCLFLALRFMPQASNAKIVFVNAGDALPGSEGDPSVIHFDTGGDEFDQHGKSLERTCSAAMLAKALGIQGDPGLTALLEMVTKVDNVEATLPTEIHALIEGAPHHKDFRGADGRPDWEKIQGYVFTAFDIVYNQERFKAQQRANLDRYAQWHTLPNGLKVVSLLWHPELRVAAFEKGAMVVLWTVTQWFNTQTGEALSQSDFNRVTARNAPEPGVWKRIFYTGIQTDARRYSQLYLDGVASELRQEEAKKRSALPLKTPWFLHDSRRLILNGSKTHTPTQEELSQLTPSEIQSAFIRALARIPRENTSQWRIATAQQ